MKTIKAHLYYCWYIYLIIIVFVSFVGNYVVNLKTRIKDYEKVSIYVGSLGVDYTNLENHLMENMDDSLLEVEILDYNQKDTYFNISLQAAGTNTDLVICPANSMSDEIKIKRFASLKELNFENKNNIKFYDDYSIIIKDDNINYLSNYITYNDGDTYCLYINKLSPNVHSLFKTKDDKYSDNGTKIIYKILGYEN